MRNHLGRWPIAAFVLAGAGLLCTSLVWAVIFATDVLHLQVDGTPVADNSVVVVMPDTGELRVCEKGGLFIRQGPTWNAGPWQFHRTDTPDLQTLEAWRQATGSDASSKADQDYLREAVAGSTPLSVTLPSLEESPPLDQTPHPSPPDNSTGGTIGHDRHFRIELATGTATQIPPPKRQSSTPTDPPPAVTPPGTTEPGTGDGVPGTTGLLVLLVHGPRLFGAKHHVPGDGVFPRLFASQPLTCPNCGADIGLIAFITKAAPIEMILTHIGEPPRRSTIGPAR